MDALDVIRQWRALPADEKARRRWANIPRSVARSMALAGEPVDQAVLEAEHALRPMPASATISTRGALVAPHALQPKEKT